MNHATTRTGPALIDTPNVEPADSPRMSFGDHLEELRSCLIRALLGVAATTIFGFFFANRVLEFIIRPLLIVQHAEGLQPNLQALSPTEMFATYIKAAIMVGLILAMPWVLYQVWKFVAAGLYVREQRFIRSLFVASTALFAIGVLFLYYLVLPVMLQFLISFNRAFDLPNLDPSFVQRLVLQDKPQSTGTPDQSVPPSLRIPLCADPPEPGAPGEMCVNPDSRRLLIKTADGLFSTPLEPGPRSPVVQSQFAVQEYMSFVLMLALAFGITFETPIVVYFLAWSNLVRTADMAAARRYVILATAILSAVLTPTSDILSQMLLGVPMYLLFEIGLILARMSERRRAAAASG